MRTASTRRSRARSTTRRERTPSTTWRCSSPAIRRSLPKINHGTNTCNSCDTPIGDYVTIALTDKTGSFTLKDVPTGRNVPLTVQIGKWRRTMNVSTVADCATTTLPSSGAGQARLPRNKSEGDLPQMALVTGGLDDLGCFMRRMGLDASEYSAPGAGGHLDIFHGNGLLGPAPTLSSGTAGDCTTASCPLWDTKPHLEKYDIVLLACEGGTFEAAKPTTAKQAMYDWLNEGGKVFATHYHYSWFQNSPQPAFKNVADWLGDSLGLGVVMGKVDVSFPKGQTFNDGLGTVNALTNGNITLTGVATSVGSVSTDASRWIYDSAKTADGGVGTTKYLSFGTPIGRLSVADGGPEANGKQYCGKAVFSDLHAGGGPKGNVPAACDTADLSAQEKALEFLFFDLAACVTDDTKPPPVPTPTPK